MGSRRSLRASHKPGSPLMSLNHPQLCAVPAGRRRLEFVDTQILLVAKGVRGVWNFHRMCDKLCTRPLRITVYLQAYSIFRTFGSGPCSLPIMCHLEAANEIEQENYPEHPHGRGPFVSASSNQWICTHF